MGIRLRIDESLSVEVPGGEITMPVGDIVARFFADNVKPHPDDIAVSHFAAVMKSKLAVSRHKGRSGWSDPALCTVEHLQAELLTHIAKGDPVDVANFAMMLFHRSAITTAAVDDGGRPRLFAAPVNIGDLWPEYGGYYAGMARGKPGESDYHLIVSTIEPEEERLTWHKAKAWCADLSTNGNGAWELPLLREQSLCYSNLKDIFQEAWYWSAEEYSSTTAHVQYFGYGDQTSDDKDLKCRVRPVRRVSAIK